MRNQLHRRALIVPAVLAFVWAGAVAARAHEASPPAPADERGASITPLAASDCNGGVQRQSLVRMEPVGFGLTEQQSFLTLPGSIVPFTVSAGTDQVVVTYSAEAALFGAPAGSSDFLQIQIWLDNAPMQPANDLVFASDVGQSSSIQVCKLVGPGTHHVWVTWKLIDQGSNNTLTGRLDDWAVHVQVSD
jgi:hypothetical protein